MPQNHTSQVGKSKRNRIATESLLIDTFVTHSVESDDATWRYSRFTARKHLLLDSATSWWTISDMLSRVLVPLHAQPFIICNIATSARELNASETAPLTVSLFAGAEVFRVSVFMESAREEKHGFCVICLGEIMRRCEISELPCLHCYHRDCIMSWFEKNNVCPLCRFEIPLDWE